MSFKITYCKYMILICFPYFSVVSTRENQVALKKLSYSFLKALAQIKTKFSKINTKNLTYDIFSYFLPV